MTHLELITALVDETRNVRGMRVSELARRVAVDPKRLYGVLAAEHVMQADELVRMCCVLGVGIDQLSCSALGIEDPADAERAGRLVAGMGK